MKNRTLAVVLALSAGLALLAVAVPVGLRAATRGPAWLLLIPVHPMSYTYLRFHPGWRDQNPD